MAKMIHVQMDLNFLFIVLLFFVLFRHGKTESFYERCDEENSSTLVCNFVPKQVQEPYVNIRIRNFKREDQLVAFNNSTFTDASWMKVQTLELSDQSGREWNCTFSYGSFTGLTALKELRLHMSYFWFEPGVLVGLPSVQTLDLSRCYRLVMEDLTEQLKIPNTLPVLQKLFLSEVGSYDKRNNINSLVVDALLPRNITVIDISKTQIQFINVTAIVKGLKSLEYINVSYSIIEDIWRNPNENIPQADVSHVKIVDISYTTLPSKLIRFLPGKFVAANLRAKYSDINNPELANNVFTPLIINASGIVPKTSSVWIYNITIVLDKPFHWKVKQLISRDNNIRYLDVRLKCSVFKLTSLVHVDLSNNGLEMLRSPTCMPNLATLDISKNRLFRMVEKSLGMFEEMFSALKKLRVINLSDNLLPELPRNLFINNKDIQIIDLSFNKLEQFQLDLADLHQLRVLDLSNNKIMILNELSMNNLNGISSEKSSFSFYCSIVLTSNPIECSTCESKPFINWLMTSKRVNNTARRLTCKNENGNNVNLNNSIVKQLQSICSRRTMIATYVVLTCIAIIISIMTVVFIYRRRQKFQRKRKRANVMDKLIEGEGQYEFAVFLSYSSKDEQFVLENVIDQLNENLQLMTGIERNLVCTGDQYLRPGFLVHDETIRCLDRASVMIIAVSNNFCRSVYCQNEFDQAYMQRKPIVLMLKEHVDENLMMPAMKQLYQRDVRILWTVENGQFEMKTTWENVCRSVLDKVQI